MREITADTIVQTVKKLCVEANCHLNSDIKQALHEGLQKEESDVGKDIILSIIENAQVADTEDMPICQDTGMAVVFMEVGQEVCIRGGDLTEAVNEGVRNGYKDGYLRKSVVEDPINRNNSGDNTPAVIHYKIVKGDSLKIRVMPKGFGSENMSAVKMLKPSDGINGIKEFILETVDKAGPNPCPPIVVGVGIGGTFEKAALMAKEALLRPVNKRNETAHIKELEEEMLQRINKLGLGPSGLGGTITALGVNVEVFPTHIAGLPVAVNISCHATRHAEAVL